LRKYSRVFQLAGSGASAITVKLKQKKERLQKMALNAPQEISRLRHDEK
jgi:hypothetical protein